MTDSKIFDQERAENYDDRIVRHSPGYDVLHALSETILADDLSADASLLVAGIGTGMEILQWAPKHPTWSFLGIDPSEAMISLAKSKISSAGLLNSIDLKVVAVETLPNTITFDAATLLLVLHFVPDHGQKAELLSAIADRLNPGAPFLLATMFGDAESTRFKKMIAFTKSWAISHGMDVEKATELCNPARRDLHIVPEERIKMLLREAGFIDIQRYYQAATIGAWMARAPR